VFAARKVLNWIGLARAGTETSKDGHWVCQAFKGTRWQSVNYESRRLYLKNAYRVILTRARQGMILFVPKGDASDHTRPPSFYDGTWEFLLSCGIPPIDCIVAATAEPCTTPVPRFLGPCQSRSRTFNRGMRGQTKLSPTLFSDAKPLRSDRCSLPCSTPPRSPSRISPSSRRKHRLPREYAAASANRRSDRHECRST
jgi:hypothetical protein